MKIDLTAKTALVTGSTSGIGHAIAKGLAAAGATVVIKAGRKARSTPRSRRSRRPCPAPKSAALPPTSRRRPGVETFVKDLARQNGQSVEEAASQFVKQFRLTSLLQRFASVDEIANMVVYISSKEASATNGAALRAEGGIVQTIA